MIVEKIRGEQHLSNNTNKYSPKRTRTSRAVAIGPRRHLKKCIGAQTPQRWQLKRSSGQPGLSEITNAKNRGFQ